MNQARDVRAGEAYPRPWVFYASFPISLLLAIALASMEFDPDRDLCAYGFGLLCAIGYYAIGRKERNIRFVRSGLGLLYLAPFLPLLVAVAYEALFLASR
jgi:hypothetical protein